MWCRVVSHGWCVWYRYGADRYPVYSFVSCRLLLDRDFCMCVALEWAMDKEKYGFMYSSMVCIYAYGQGSVDQINSTVPYYVCMQLFSL